MAFFDTNVEAQFSGKTLLADGWYPLTVTGSEKKDWDGQNLLEVQFDTEDGDSLDNTCWGYDDPSKKGFKDLKQMINAAKGEGFIVKTQKGLVGLKMMGRVITKEGKQKVNQETGEPMTDDNGKPVLWKNNMIVKFKPMEKNEKSSGGAW